jgi:hypothetical protein
MKNLKSIVAGLCFGIAALGMTTGSAQATLLELDLNVAGDKLITLDTETGLEWLDLTATLGQAHDTALLSTFVTTQGFRHAIQGEVLTLLENFGGTVNTANSGTTFTSSNFAPAVNFLDLLGCTSNCSSTTFAFANGIFEGGSFPSTAAFIGRNTDTLTGSFTLEQGSYSNTGVDGFVGNFLVRETLIDLPEPGTLAIVGFGLAGLGLMRRRRG